MALDPHNLPAEVIEFMAERHLASLTTIRPDGTPHVSPVGFSFVPQAATALIITFAGSRKVRNLTARPGGPAALCQVDRGRWVTLEGTATVVDEPERVARAVAGYAARYGPPGEREDRVAIELEVVRVLGRA